MFRFKKKNKDFVSKFEEFKPIIKENKMLIKQSGLDEVILRHFEKTQVHQMKIGIF